MITLARDGIFPVTKDKNGAPLPCLPASGLDVPGTIQGEGKLNGIPSLFVRLAGCNLRCRWKTDTGSVSSCDTAYAAYAVKNAYSLPAGEIYAIIRHNTGNIKHIVITGGEPFLQAGELQELCRMLKQDGYHLTIETNATLFDETLSAYVDLFSMSPKLDSSAPNAPYDKHHNELRISIKTIQRFIDCARHTSKDFQLKFVCASGKDIDEIKTILSQLKGWKNEDILLMPLGGNAEELRLNMKTTLEHCVRNGWRYCDRLHISLFGSKQGV